MLAQGGTHRYLVQGVSVLEDDPCAVMRATEENPPNPHGTSLTVTIISTWNALLRNRTPSINVHSQGKGQLESGSSRTTRPKKNR